MSGRPSEPRLSSRRSSLSLDDRRRKTTIGLERRAGDQRQARCRPAGWWGHPRPGSHLPGTRRRQLRPRSHRAGTHRAGSHRPWSHRAGTHRPRARRPQLRPRSHRTWTGPARSPDRARRKRLRGSDTRADAGDCTKHRPDHDRRSKSGAARRLLLHDFSLPFRRVCPTVAENSLYLHGIRR